MSVNALYSVSEAQRTLRLLQSRQSLQFESLAQRSTRENKHSNDVCLSFLLHSLQGYFNATRVLINALNGDGDVDEYSSKPEFAFDMLCE
jgi:hypothetical protein